MSWMLILDMCNGLRPQSALNLLQAVFFFSFCCFFVCLFFFILALCDVSAVVIPNINISATQLWL